MLIGKRLDFNVDVGDNRAFDQGLELLMKDGNGKLHLVKMESPDGRVYKGHCVCAIPGETEFDVRALLFCFSFKLLTYFFVKPSHI